MSKLSQNEIVLRHIKKYGHITTWQAITRYKITRLSRVIHDLNELLTPACLYYENKRIIDGPMIRRAGKVYKKYTLQ